MSAPCWCYMKSLRIIYASKTQPLEKYCVKLSYKSIRWISAWITATNQQISYINVWSYSILPTHTLSDLSVSFVGSSIGQAVVCMVITSVDWHQHNYWWIFVNGNEAPTIKWAQKELIQSRCAADQRNLPPRRERQTRKKARPVKGSNQ